MSLKRAIQWKRYSEAEQVVLAQKHGGKVNDIETLSDNVKLAIMLECRASVKNPNEKLNAAYERAIERRNAVSPLGFPFRFELKELSGFFVV